MQKRSRGRRLPTRRQQVPSVPSMLPAARVDSQSPQGTQPFQIRARLSNRIFSHLASLSPAHTLRAECPAPSSRASLGSTLHTNFTPAGCRCAEHSAKNTIVSQGRENSASPRRQPLVTGPHAGFPCAHTARPPLPCCTGTGRDAPQRPTDRSRRPAPLPSVPPTAAPQIDGGAGQPEAVPRAAAPTPCAALPVHWGGGGAGVGESHAGPSAALVGQSRGGRARGACLATPGLPPPTFLLQGASVRPTPAPPGTLLGWAGRPLDAALAGTAELRHLGYPGKSEGSAVQAALRGGPSGASLAAAGRAQPR